MSRFASLMFMLFAMMLVVTRAEDAEEGDGDMASMIETLDTDKDGSLSLDEILQSFEADTESSEEREEKEKLVASIKEKFGAHDTSKDGKLDPSELKAFVNAFDDEEM
eukprot:TRINITY_DN2795_c0_g1_i3.p1 TRINITY_DN2795_c0_g1~~TRINITY_DN2795_c0_g1_i3.p1  ORF type:complete len:108 (-),score=39.54 TRINITY_DN2795_c0_g1_i3:69-392(-)